jgi:hypothetical protein
MTTTRTLILSVASFFLPFDTHAAPPSDLTGRYVSLKGDRIEFPTASSGTNGAEAVTYTYSVTNATTSSLVVNYPASGRRRTVTLTFLADGSPLEYREFDLVSINPPMPPIFRSGTFETGLLEVVPPPPVESSAPDALTGLFLQTGKKRLEFLTEGRGRLFIPGKSAYFTYLYNISDEDSARAELTYEDGVRSAVVEVNFDAQGRPVSFTATEERAGSAGVTASGPFTMGTNRHLADLQIGTDPEKLAGADHFGAFGLFQTVGQCGKDMDTLVYPFVVENDGDTDAFRLRASRDRHSYRVEYFSYPARENVTAAMVAGTFETTALEHGETAAFTMELTPLRANGAFLGEISARSLSVAEARDAVHSLSLVKARSKHESGKKKRR